MRSGKRSSRSGERRDWCVAVERVAVINWFRAEGFLMANCTPKDMFIVGLIGCAMEPNNSR